MFKIIFGIGNVHISYISSMKEERISHLGLPEDVVLKVPYLFIKGNYSLTIENHKGIIELNSKNIKVRYNKGCIHVFGSGLKVSSYSLEEMILTGTIDGITYYYE